MRAKSIDGEAKKQDGTISLATNNNTSFEQLNRSQSQESVKSKLSLSTSAISSSIGHPKANLNFSIN